MSIRDISTTIRSALGGPVVRPILFARLNLASGALRLHTEIGPRDAVHPVYGSETYLGVGDFGGINGDFEEEISNASSPIKLALSGVSSSLIFTALDASEYHRREVDLMFGFDDADGVLIDDPVVLTTYYMDTCDVTLDQGKANLVMTCESEEILLQEASDLRFTDEQMQSDYSGDLGGEYIYRMLDIELPWGDDKVTADAGRRINIGIG